MLASQPIRILHTWALPVERRRGRGTACLVLAKPYNGLLLGPHWLMSGLSGSTTLNQVCWVVMPTPSPSLLALPGTTCATSWTTPWTSSSPPTPAPWTTSSRLAGHKNIWSAHLRASYTSVAPLPVLAGPYAPSTSPSSPSTQVVIDQAQSVNAIHYYFLVRGPWV